MFIDASQVSPQAVVSADVCIIGAGAAGVALAKSLAGSKTQVVVLEAGGEELNKEAQELYRGRNVGLPYPELHTLRSRYFGGSSNCWGGWCRPFEDHDFKHREWVPHSGWPFGKSELDRHYKGACEICSVPHDKFDLTALDRDTNGQVCEDGKKLDVLVSRSERVDTVISQISAQPRIGQKYRHELEQASNIKTYLNANVIELETFENGAAVDSVLVGTLCDKRFRVRAKLFVLATGGLENARLLLVSDKHHAAGLGNHNDLVGRFFMEHPQIGLGTITAQRQDLSLSRYDGVNSYVPGAFCASISINEKTAEQEQLLSHGTYIFGTYAGEMTGGAEALRNMYRAVRRPVFTDNFTNRGPKFWLTNMARSAKGAAGVAAYLYGRLRHDETMITSRRIIHYCEQAPNPDSRVKLNADKDRFGKNQIDLDWRLSALEKHTLNRANEIVREELAIDQLVSLDNAVTLDPATNDWPSDLQWGWHQLGTTRMHNDPRQGVVDADCRVHGVDNLYIAGGSVFPTCGANYPTITIVALALRLAEHVAHRLAAGATFHASNGSTTIAQSEETAV